MPEDAQRLEGSLAAIAREYGLPADVGLAEAVGAEGVTWRLESPSLGAAWHLRVSPPPAEQGFYGAFRDGLRLTSLARRAGLSLAEPLQVASDPAGQVTEDVPAVVVRPWLPGRHVDSPIADSQPGSLTDWLGSHLAGLHSLWPLARLDEDALRSRYGLYARDDWERRFNDAYDADLSWTALAPDGLPVIEEASRLVAAGLGIRDLQPVITHRQVVARHVIVGDGEMTLIDPFDAGPDLAWLETVDVAVLFEDAAVVEAARREGEPAGPRVAEALARTFGRDLAELATLMERSVRGVADDELASRLTARIEDAVDRLTTRVETIERLTQLVFP